jgi:microcompartment protein CcmK/EutM
MELAQVLGSVTATAKTESLLAHKLMVVQPLDPAGSDARPAGSDARPAGSDARPAEVAVDTVGAGPGDRVLIVRGSAARQPPESRATATDLTIVAIVDAVDLSTGTSAAQEPTKTRSK